MIEQFFGTPRELLLDLRLISLAVIVAMAYFGEGSLENWSTIYLRDFVNLPVALGASGVVVFHLAMQTGRMTSMDHCTTTCQDG